MWLPTAALAAITVCALLPHCAALRLAVCMTGRAKAHCVARPLAYGGLSWVPVEWEQSVVQWPAEAPWRLAASGFQERPAQGLQVELARQAWRGPLGLREELARRVPQAHRRSTRRIRLRPRLRPSSSTN